MLDKCLCKHTTWEQCVALFIDNESTMSGMIKGLNGFVHRKQDKVLITGCTCHLIHLAAGEAAAKLQIKNDDDLIDIYFYLEKSQKHHILLEEF